MANLLALWGKTAAGGTYHPALFHMLDVGHVAQQLLSEAGPSRMRRVLGEVFTVANPHALAAWLPLVTALHDIGKVSAPFQGQVPEQRARLTALGFTFVSGDYRHQHLSAIAIGRLPPRLGLPEGVRPVIADAFGGHHGGFASPIALRKVRTFLQNTEPPEWPALRTEAVETLRTMLPAPDTVDMRPVNLRAATAALTGFLILCDWLGSDQTYFAPSSSVSMADYAPLSRARAERAVAAAGFLAARRAPQWQGFRTVFPQIPSPRPLQTAIDDLRAEAVGWPGLYVIEAPTGEGKTEAALALARRLAALRGSDELYVALPTQATSNQMFGRVQRFLSAGSGDPAAVKLVHGQALLFADDVAERPYGDSVDTDSPAAAVPAWFAPKKRALVAPYGVGTIDQAELAVLNARHYMLRLFGLAGKVVILDEVHAYDAYMSTIIEHALWWLAALGTSVILLSATLPVRRHRQLAGAYLAGLNGLSPASEASDPGAPLPYPLLSAYTPAGWTRASPPAAQPDRPLTLEITSDRSPSEEAAYLLDLVHDGGAVCRVTNTVARAQEIAAALRAIAPPDVERYLLHARLPGDDRLAREDRLAARVGPGSSRTPADRIIVVGTQVLEQSLDYDVDFMISDFAPIDLLLQRAGRLHRHAARQRPHRFREPVLQVVLGNDARGAPAFGASRFVYEPFVLWKSWLTLRSRQDAAGRIALHLPADYRPLIEAVYDDRSDVLPLTDPLRSLLDVALEEYRRGQAAMRESASQRLIPKPEPDLPISEDQPLIFEEDEDGGKQGWGVAATRYGQQSISVIPLHRTPAGIAVRRDGQPLTAARCDRDCQLRLLRRAVRISHPRLVAELPRGVHPQLSWMGRLPLLRYHVPLVLENDRAEIGGVVVRLDAELGLVIGEEDAP